MGYANEIQKKTKALLESVENKELGKTRVKLRTWYGDMGDEIGMIVNVIQNDPDTWFANRDNTDFPHSDFYATLDANQMIKIERTIRKAIKSAKYYAEKQGNPMPSAEDIRERWQIQLQPPYGSWGDAVIKGNTLMWGYIAQ